MNEILLASKLVEYLKENGVSFNEKGYPILKEEWLAKTKPSFIVPFNKRQYFRNEQDVSICFFSKDENLYPRLAKIFDEMQIYKRYHSVCMMDISVSPYMHREVQNFNLLLNMLFIAVLGVNQIKIIPSYRSGELETVEVLKECIPEPEFWVMGAVGTQKAKNNDYFNLLFTHKCLMLNPKLILSYGKPSAKTTEQLKEFSIELITYRDFRDLSYSEEISYERL